jgi:hypothetical protein
MEPPQLPEILTRNAGPGCGLPAKTLASLLGHSDSRITMQFYNRVTVANRAAAAAAIDNLFAGHFHSTATGAESEEAGCPRWVNVSPCQM